jgi:hypothetical protein
LRRHAPNIGPARRDGDDLNPLLRVALDRSAAIAREAGAPLVVDNTFATPADRASAELGAHFVVHSLTKYLSGHGDVWAASWSPMRASRSILRALSRTWATVLGPFECYLPCAASRRSPAHGAAMRQRAASPNGWRRTRRGACLLPGRSGNHPDAANIRRLFCRRPVRRHRQLRSEGRGRERIFRLMNALRMIVPATSLGDVHSMMLYPAMSSHRDICAETPRALGHPRQSGAALGGHRSRGGHHRRSGPGAAGASWCII